MARREGKLYLVGAGPGAPELLTGRAQRLIRSCDILLFDQSISGDLLGLASRDAELIGIGDEYGPENYLSRRLIQRIRLGLEAVRLGAGDPFSEGRLLEEAFLCREEGIAFEIVPGISLLSEACSQAGIPLFEKTLSRSVLFIKGPFQNLIEESKEQREATPPQESERRRGGVRIRRRRKAPEGKDAPRLRVSSEFRPAADGLWLRSGRSDTRPANRGGSESHAVPVDWEAAVKAAETIVVGNVQGAISIIRDGLLEGGAAAETPVALLDGGAEGVAAAQFSCLREMERDFSGERLSSTSFLVVGDVINLREALVPSEQEQSLGKRYAVVFTGEFEESLDRWITMRGGEAVHFEVSRYTTIPGILEEMELLSDDLRQATHLFFSSEAVVDRFLDIMGKGLDIRSLDGNCRLGVTEQSARDRLAASGMVSSLLDTHQLEAFLGGNRHALVVMLCEAGPEPALAGHFRKANARLLAVPLLDRVPSKGCIYDLQSELLNGQLAVVVFCSPLAVRCLAEQLGEGMLRNLLEEPEVISIGKETGQELSRAGVLFRPWRRPGEKPPDGARSRAEKNRDTDW